MAWLNKKTGPPAKHLETADDVKSFVEPRDVTVIGFFTDKESELAKAFIKAADSVDDIEFGITTPASSGEYKVNEDKIVVLKKVSQCPFFIYFQTCRFLYQVNSLFLFSLMIYVLTTVVKLLLMLSRLSSRQKPLL